MARSRVGTRRALPDGRVRVTVSHGYTADGRQRRVSRIAMDEADADRVALELAAELGRRPDLGRGVTLSMWWAAYSAGKGARLARSTYKRYEGDMRRTWLPAMGGVDISLITRHAVQGALLSIPTRQSATHALRSLSAVLTQAVREGLLERNPIRQGGFEMPGDVGAVCGESLDLGPDPFAAIEGTSDVWDARTVLAAMPLLEGVPLEPCWLCMVGAGVRREEALALQWRDVRRVEVGGVPVTQLAVYKALTPDDGLKRTKTRRSVRIVAMMEPFGGRLWELRDEPALPVCPVSAGNIQHRWHALFEPVTSKHAKTEGRNKGRLAHLPYVPLNRMRATHASFVQQAGVSDSLNSLMHGHSQRVAYSNYQRADTVGATIRVGEFVAVDGATNVRAG